RVHPARTSGLADRAIRHAVEHRRRVDLRGERVAQRILEPAHHASFPANPAGGPEAARTDTTNTSGASAGWPGTARIGTGSFGTGSLGTACAGIAERGADRAAAVAPAGSMPSSAKRVRNVANARAHWLLTVPSATPSTAAISASDRSS